ncbi:hypothetical protein SDC9_94843 [bioreactor metagenome]|uniref:Uncharacterized protein n=1 Tax=bioreactor metagenome TaxID=1076179 RepID=A0A645A752_9ZZZZ
MVGAAAPFGHPAERPRYNTRFSGDHHRHDVPFRGFLENFAACIRDDRCHRIAAYLLSRLQPRSAPEFRFPELPIRPDRFLARPVWGQYRGRLSIGAKHESDRIRQTVRQRPRRFRSLRAGARLRYDLFHYRREFRFHRRLFSHFYLFSADLPNDPHLF